jgi:hypothetical protein
MLRLVSPLVGNYFCPQEEFESLSKGPCPGRVLLKKSELVIVEP